MPIGLDEASLTTSEEAACAYRTGMIALRTTPDRALRHFACALALDPTFAMAHAAVALVGHELHAPVDVHARLGTALLHARRASAAEHRFVREVAGRLSATSRAVS